MSRKDELLEVEADEPEMLHSILSKLPKPLDLERLISRTSELFRQHPPERLPGRAWAHISSNSVLKTTRDLKQLGHQSLQDGEKLYQKHASEIRRHDARRKMQEQAMLLARRHRRSLTATGTAVLVAVFAFYVRRYGVLPVDSDWFVSIPGLRAKAAELMHRFLQ